MTINPKGLVQQPGQGTTYWFDRDLYTSKAVGEDTPFKSRRSRKNSRHCTQVWD